MIKYVDIKDHMCPQNPKGEIIQRELERTIRVIEKQNDVKFISVCLLGKKRQKRRWFSIKKDVTYEFLLFFE